MGIEENWQSFVNMTRGKAISHGKASQYWDRIHNILSLTLIFISGLTTLATLLPMLTNYVAAGLGAATTLVSAVAGSLNPSSRRQVQMESSRGFRALMLKMVRVETEREYEELWKEYNKELLNEPFLPRRFKVKDNTNFTMTPEFKIVVAQKKAEVEDAVLELETERNSLAADEIVAQTKAEVEDAVLELESERNSLAADEADCVPGSVTKSENSELEEEEDIDLKSI
jgi:hypothetical protein